MARPVAAVAGALAVVALSAGPSAAWTFRSAVDRTCTAAGVQLVVHFTNTEPNQSQVMTVTATDLQTNKSVSLGNVGPGHSTDGKIDTALQSVKAGKIRFDLAWASNPQARDQQLVTYAAIGCDPPPAVPDGLSGWTLAAIVAGAAGVFTWRRRAAHVEARTES